MKSTDPFWTVVEHGGKTEIRSTQINQDYAVIYPGPSRFEVRVFYTISTPPDLDLGFPPLEAERRESTVLPTLKEAKAFAEEILFKNN